MMIAVRIRNLPLTRPESPVAPPLQRHELLVALDGTTVDLTRVRSVGRHFHPRRDLGVERVLLHRPQYDGLERRRHDNDDAPLLGALAHFRIGLRTEPRLDELVVERHEVLVDFRLGLAHERLEHLATDPALVLGQAPFVREPPEPDFQRCQRRDLMLEYESVDQPGWRRPLDGRVVEVEYRDLGFVCQLLLHDLVIVPKTDGARGRKGTGAMHHWQKAIHGLAHRDLP